MSATTATDLADMLGRPTPRVLTHEEAAALSARGFKPLEAFRRYGFMYPMAGGDGTDDDSGGGGSDDDSNDDDDGDNDDDDSSGDRDGDDDDDDGDDDRVPKSELEAAERRASDERKRARKLARENRKLKQQKGGGDDSEDAQRADEAEKKLGKMTTQMRRTEMNRAVVAQASSMGFRNPQLATKLVELDVDDVVDLDDETYEPDVDNKAIERELERLVRADKYLVKEGKRQRRETSGDDDEDRGKRRRQRSDDRDQDRDDDRPAMGIGTLRQAFKDADRVGSGSR